MDDDGRSQPPRSEVDGIPVAPEPTPSDHVPVIYNPPLPQPPKLDLKMPKMRKVSPEEESRWCSITSWEGTFSSESRSDMTGRLFVFNTDHHSRTRAEVRLDLERDPSQTVSGVRLVWKGTATLVEATYDTSGTYDIKPLNPVFAGGSNLQESGSDSGKKIEGDVYLIVSPHMGTYEIRVPSTTIKKKQSIKGNVSAAWGTNDSFNESDEGTEEVSFGCSLEPLPQFDDPDSPPKLTGSMSQDVNFIVQLHMESKWDLQCKNLKAHAGGPYSVERGAELKLDASKSKPLGDIVEFEWTFEPTDPPKPPDLGYPPRQPPRSDAKKTCKSPTCTVVVLDNLTAKLKVTDNKGCTATSDPVKITCRPRKFPATPVEEVSAVKHAELVMGSSTQFGRNTCSLDDGPVGRDEAEHYYHRDPAKHTWRDIGYSTDKVEDEKDGVGPYHGFYVVKEHKLRISRQLVVNRKITPADTSGSEFPPGVCGPLFLPRPGPNPPDALPITDEYNRQKQQPPPPPKKGSTTPHPYVCGCDRLARCVEAHEQLHTDFILAAARGSFKNVTARSGKVDPADRIERLFFDSEDTLCTWADVEIRYSDEECQKATAGEDREAEIHGRLVRMGYSEVVTVYVPGSAGGWRALTGVLGEFGDGKE
ncbi:hypothetical protein DFJ74DRAFT_692920 [Hyaloraphidium curvatum]|nr:hypothetical protein DFJ74DRAFT_692920 [Hyaloraphidium curvatum]